MSIFSWQFILFAAIVLFLYFLIPKKYQWGLLLIVSYIFYGMSGWKTVPYLVITTIVTYAAAMLVENRQAQFRTEVQAAPEGFSVADKNLLKKKCTADKRRMLAIALVITFSFLAYFKYLNTIIIQISDMFQNAHLEPIQLIVPLGISFYTFQSAGYLIDVYRGKIKAEKNFLKFALFVSYFPQIIQGPISRFKEIGGQLFEEHSFDYTRVKFGLQRMLWGYFQKLVVADRLAVLVNEIFANYTVKGYTGFVIFTGVFLYGIQIYCDFCGGMDIISGLSDCFGITLPINFHHPFSAKSVAEFWQRWHITLGAWLKNYLFYPMALSKPFSRMGKYLKKHVGNYAGKILPTCLASFITFFLIGIWHGANWKYVFYGFYQAMFVSTATLLEPFYQKCRTTLHINTESWYMNAFRTLRTILLITIGRYFSRAADFGTAVDMLKETFTVWNPEILFNGTIRTIARSAGMDLANVLLACVLIGFVFLVDGLREHGISLRGWVAEQNIIVRYTIYLVGIFSILLFGMYGQGVGSGSFIYQGF